MRLRFKITMPNPFCAFQWENFTSDFSMRNFCFGFSHDRKTRSERRTENPRAEKKRNLSIDLNNRKKNHPTTHPKEEWEMIFTILAQWTARKAGEGWREKHFQGVVHFFHFHPSSDVKRFVFLHPTHLVCANGWKKHFEMHFPGIGTEIFSPMVSGRGFASDTWTILTQILGRLI